MMNIVKQFALFLTAVLFMACAGNPATAESQGADELDAAVREISDYLNKQLPKGNKLVILNIQSAYPALSEYIIDELIANTVNDRIFTVVDRRQLDTIRAELDFQYSGEVDDDTMQALGRMAGAQVIVSGAVSKIGDLYRLRVRALSVQSAAIEGQFNRNIPDGPTVAALVRSQATGYGESSARPVTATATKPVAAQAVASAPAAPAPAPASTPVVPVPVAPPAPITYKIGDTGPAGGFIFYDKGTSSGGWRYLEAAPADLGKSKWQSDPRDVAGTKDTIGSGKQNTQLIGENGRAVLLCQQSSQGGFRDWFLPSKTELDLMYINLKMKDLGNFF
jgi:TolB-like protein